MKLVIDIDEDVYTILHNFDWESVPDEEFDAMAAYELTVARGKPLEDELADMWVVMVETEQMEMFPVVVCNTYEKAFSEATRYIEQKSNDPFIGLKMQTPLDFDCGIASFTTENEYVGNGKIVISKVAWKAR